MPDEFQILGSFEEYIAKEELHGAAIRVPDSTMEPVIFEDDVVQVEKRDALQGEVVCVRMNGAYVFGYNFGDVLKRENGSNVNLSGKEQVMGVVTTIIDRDLQKKR